MFFVPPLATGQPTDLAWSLAKCRVEQGWAGGPTHPQPPCSTFHVKRHEFNSLKPFICYLTRAKRNSTCSDFPFYFLLPSVSRGGWHFYQWSILRSKARNVKRQTDEQLILEETWLLSGASSGNERLYIITFNLSLECFANFLSKYGPLSWTA